MKSGGKEVSAKFNSHPEKIERTGETTFNVHHDDGSVFEMTGSREAIEKLARQKSPPRTKKMFGGVGPGRCKR